MKKIIGILLMFALLATGCVRQLSEADYIPVNTMNTSSEGNIVVGESRKVVTFQGSMFLDETVNRWIENNPDKKIVSLNVIPLGDGYGRTLVIIVYEQGNGANPSKEKRQKWDWTQ